MFHKVKAWARRLKRDVHAIYLAARSPRVPWHAKIIAIAVAGYALSPVDLIPDFIPVLGYVDDLIIVPLGIWLVLSLIPEEVMAEYRAIADKAETPPAARSPRSVSLRFGLLGRLRSVGSGLPAGVDQTKPSLVLHCRSLSPESLLIGACALALRSI
jgi:uncharacterized membrane protein YkvA (DUF1232 family)